MPNTFDAGVDVVVIGKYASNGALITADQLQTKCPSKYKGSGLTRSPDDRAVRSDDLRELGTYSLVATLIFALGAAWLLALGAWSDAQGPDPLRLLRRLRLLPDHRRRVGGAAAGVPEEGLQLRLRGRELGLHALGLLPHRRLLGRAVGLVPALAAAPRRSPPSSSPSSTSTGSSGSPPARSRCSASSPPCSPRSWSSTRAPTRSSRPQPAPCRSASTRCCCTRPWCCTRRRCSSGTSASPCRSRSPSPRCCSAAATSSGCSARRSGPCSAGSSSRWASASAPGGPTSCSASAATGPGTPWRTPRWCRGSRRRRCCTRSRSTSRAACSSAGRSAWPPRPSGSPSSRRGRRAPGLISSVHAFGKNPRARSGSSRPSWSWPPSAAPRSSPGAGARSTATTRSRAGSRATSSTTSPTCCSRCSPWPWPSAPSPCRCSWTGRSGRAPTTPWPRPLGVVILAMIAVCPLLAWRKTDGAQLRKTLILPAVTMLLSVPLWLYLGLPVQRVGLHRPPGLRLRLRRRHPVRAALGAGGRPDPTGASGPAWGAPSPAAARAPPPTSSTSAWCSSSPACSARPSTRSSSRPSSRSSRARPRASNGYTLTYKGMSESTGAAELDARRGHVRRAPRTATSLGTLGPHTDVFPASGAAVRAVILGRPFEDLFVVADEPFDTHVQDHRPAHGHLPAHPLGVDRLDPALRRRRRLALAQGPDAGAGGRAVGEPAEADGATA